MTPAFGFSAGDLMSAIGLIKKINKSLKDVGGASMEYQSVIVELKALEDVLRHLRALEPTEDNLHHVNAIRCMALACQLPLQEFLTGIEKYEASLGPWSRQTTLASASRKVKWALSITDQVEKFRALVAAKNISINVLLATHSSQTLSTMNARLKQEQKDLHCKVAEHRSKLEKVQASIENLEGNISQQSATVCERLDTISEKADALQPSTLSIRHLSDQFMAYIRTFPKESIELLKNVIKNNAQIYQTLMQIQQSVSRTPSSLQASNLRFTNVLGEYRELPYEYFCQWEAFEGFLKAQFKGKPGETKVLNGRYHIVNITENTKSVIKREHWSRSISEGARLDMSMVMSSIRRNSTSCPRPGCIGKVVDVCNVSNLCVCHSCHLNFFLTRDEIEDVLGRASLLDEEEDITQKQVREDIQTFGSRPEPIEFTQIDEHKSVRKVQLSSKRSAAALEDRIDNPAKVRKEADSRHTHSLTAMDWNSGASHLDAWLNQSAIPAAASAMNEQQEETKSPAISSSSANAAQEMEEIGLFRNVHICSASEPVIDGRHLVSADELANSELDTQIYYRNILDRHSELPPYLALRLARANRDRAERLRRSKINRNIPHTFHSDQQKVPGAPVLLPQSPERRGLGEPDNRTQKKYRCEVCDKRFTRPSSLQTHMYSHSGEKPYPCEFEGCGRRFSVFSNLRRHRKVHKQDVQSAYDFWSKDWSTWPADPQDSDTGSLGARKISTHRQSPSGETEHQAACTQIMQGTNGKPESPSFPPQAKWHPVKLLRGSTAIDVNSIAERKMTSLGQSIFETDSERSQLYTKRSDFWTGRVTRPRRDSMDSLSSSMNSSLHGTAIFDPEEQEPAFCDYNSRSSVNISESPRGLPPPPVEIGKKHSFECDICGNTIRVDRRLEWQQHVLEDLQPYTCTVKDCTVADRVYASRAAFSQHEALEHPLMGVLDPNKNVDPKCLFCNEDIGVDRTERGRHTGRHMEEIAFAIVTKPYEEWDFYSTSSERNLDGQGSEYTEHSGKSCICHQCGVKLHIFAQRAKHFVSINGLGVDEARVQGGSGYQCRRSNKSERPPCNTVFTTPLDLIKHILYLHEKAIKFICENCNGETLLPKTPIRIKLNDLLSALHKKVDYGLCGDSEPSNELLRLAEAPPSW